MNKGFYGFPKNRTALDPTVPSASYALTASYALNGGGGGSTFPYTGSAGISGSLLVDGNIAIGITSSEYKLDVFGASRFSNDVNITGSLNVSQNLNVLGTASFQYLATIYETASVIYSSGSNQFGDASDDVQTLYGTVVMPTGSLKITGSAIATKGFTGSLQGTASWATNAITSYTPISTTGSTIYSTSPTTGNVSANNSIFLGGNSGGGATSANFSIFLGYYAGQLATSANESIIVGPLAGLESTKANNSIFLGSGAGYKAASASYSIIMGSYAGSAGDVTPSAVSVGTNNIILGNYVSLPSKSKDSINIGGIIFATGSYSTFGTVSSGSQYGIGKVGINKVTPEYTLDVSGSGNYSNNLTLTGSLFVTKSTISKIDYIEFTSASDQPTLAARLGWNDSDGTLSLGAKGGNVNILLGESEYAYVYNAETSSLNKGEIVYISGSQGNRIAVKRASATAELGSANTLGVVAEPITNGSTGFIIVNGVIGNLDTSNLIAGSLLYLSSSAGQYTQTIPPPPYHSVRIGYVQRVHANVGSIYIKIDNGYEIDELHNVLDASTTASYGDLFIKSGSLWINSKSLTGSYSITGSLVSTQGFTGSLQGTASWANNTITASYVQTAQTASYVLQAVSSSYATTSSYALNGGVTQIIAGTNITLSPSNGLGQVTINSTAGGGGTGAGSNISQSFSNLSTWTFVHGLGTQGVIIQTYDNNWNQIVPQNISASSTTTAVITFSSTRSGYAIASLGGSTTTAQTASYVLNAVSSSYAATASYVVTALTASYVTSSRIVGTVTSASYAVTSSYVNTLNQNIIITGSVAIGTGSAGSGESNLVLGPAPAGGTGEGGQIALLAVGGTYTSSSFLDNYQNQFRVLSGPGTTSNVGVLTIDLQTKGANFQGAVTASAYSGLPNDYLYVNRNTDQTVGSNWASTDIIFNNSVVSKGISYNTGTGLASLTGGKVYRITSRLAWSAAAAYLLEYSCYTSANSQIGPITQIVQSTNGSNNISDGTLDFIYAPNSNTDIKIRTTANTTALSGEKVRGDLNTQLIIQQIA